MTPEQSTETRLERVLGWALPLLVAMVWAAWVVFVHVGYQRLDHPVADYGDVFRLIDQFLIPWADDISLSDRLTLLFREFQPLGHSHVLTRLAYLGSETGSGFDFSIPGHIGRVAMCAMVGGGVAFVGIAGRRSLGWKAWLTALLALLTWVRLDDVWTWTINYSSFEYVYMAMGVAYLIVLALYLTEKVGATALIAYGVVVAALGDAPGATSLVGGVVMTAWLAVRTRTVERRHAVPLIPVAASFLFWLLLTPFLQPMGRPPGGDLSSLDSVPWLGRALVQAIHATGAGSWAVLSDLLGATPDRALVTGIVAVVMAGLVVWLIFLGRPGDPVDVFAIGLIAIGLIAAAGAFRLRGNDPLYIYAARYLRFLVPIAVGSVVILSNWLIAARRRIGLVCLCVVVALVFVGRAFVGIPFLERRFHDQTWTRLASYEAGSFPYLSPEEQEAFRSDLAFYQRDRPETVARVLDWHAENVTKDG